jgi:hypothetical protein
MHNIVSENEKSCHISACTSIDYSITIDGLIYRVMFKLAGGRSYILNLNLFSVADGIYSHVLTDEAGFNMFATDEAEHLLQSGMRLSSMKHDADSL